MRILHISNGNQKHHGARYYDVGTKLSNGLIANGHHVLFMSDRDIARAATPLGIKALGVRHVNRVMLETCRNYQPDLLLLGHADMIAAETVAEARRILPKMRVVQYNVDPVFRDHNIRQITSKLPVVDATFITTAGSVLKRFSTPHARVAFMPNPVDASIEWPRCFEKPALDHDLFWALRALGKGTYQGDPRVEIPNFLAAAGDVTTSYHGMNGLPELFGAAYFQQISKAAMGLNISVTRTWGHTPQASAEELYLYASDRIAHYLGSGLLVCSTRGHALEQLFTEDKEMVFFDTPQELLEKVRYYKANPLQRMQLARAGWQKAHREYNTARVTQYLLDITLQQPLSHPYAWPCETY